jgi:hypothetical protein
MHGNKFTQFRSKDKPFVSCSPGRSWGETERWFSQFNFDNLINLAISTFQDKTMT